MTDLIDVISIYSVLISVCTVMTDFIAVISIYSVLISECTVMTDLIDVISQLLKDQSVLFSGYRMPHPLQPHVELKVQTSKDTTPQRAFGDAVNTLIVGMSDLHTKFNVCICIVEDTSY
jgi:DNA-directed RNA polymerase subunit L